MKMTLKKEEEEDRDNGMWLTFSRFAFDKFSKVCTPISPRSYSQRGMCVMNVGGMSLIHTPLLKKSLCRFVGTSYYFHYFKDAQNISPNIPCNKRETWETMKEMSQTTSVSHRHFPWKYFPFFLIFRCLQQTVMSSTTTTTNAHWKVLKWSAVYPTSAFLYYSIRKKGLPDDLPRIWIHDMRVHRPFPFTSCCILFWKKGRTTRLYRPHIQTKMLKTIFFQQKEKYLMSHIQLLKYWEFFFNDIHTHSLLKHFFFHSSALILLLWKGKTERLKKRMSQLTVESDDSVSFAVLILRHAAVGPVISARDIDDSQSQLLKK